jgi:hypothetical protein
MFRSFKLAAIKLVSPGKEHLETHCALPLPLSPWSYPANTDRL